MKKTKILSLVSLGAFLLTTSGCTDYDFDSKYEDPSKVTQVTISNLMVGVFQKVKDYDVYEYNRFFGFDSQFTGKYAQTFGYSNTTDMYTPGYIPAIDGQWDNVYSALAQFRKLESLYEEESAAEQAQDEAFYLAAKVQLYDFFAATVDVFGDMPFSEACTLPLTNDVGKSYAHYDKAEDIYKTILDELKEIAPRFRSIPTNSHYYICFLFGSFGSYFYCMTGSFRIHYFPRVSRLVYFFVQQVKNQFFTLCSRNRIDDEFYFFHSFVHAILVDCRRQK